MRESERESEEEKEGKRLAPFCSALVGANHSSMFTARQPLFFPEHTLHFNEALACILSAH